jgi:hypothetical protein
MLLYRRRTMRCTDHNPGEQQSGADEERKVVRHCGCGIPLGADATVAEGARALPAVVARVGVREVVGCRRGGWRRCAGWCRGGLHARAEANGKFSSSAAVAATMPNEGGRKASGNVVCVTDEVGSTASKGGRAALLRWGAARDARSPRGSTAAHTSQCRRSSRSISGPTQPAHQHINNSAASPITCSESKGVSSRTCSTGTAARSATFATHG